MIQIVIPVRSSFFDSSTIEREREERIKDLKDEDA